MATLAYKSMAIWDELERDAGVSLRSMTGLLNFGDKNFGEDSPEGKRQTSFEDLAHIFKGL